MANTFKNYTASCTDATETTVYTVPSATTAVIIGCNVANTTTSQIKVDVKVASKYVVKAAPIPAGAALSVLDGKIIGELCDGDWDFALGLYDRGEIVDHDVEKYWGDHCALWDTTVCEVRSGQGRTKSDSERAIT